MPDRVLPRRAVLLGGAAASLAAASCGREESPAVTPERFGARANGRADDTAALQAAARAAAGAVLTLKAGGVYLTRGVELPAGTALHGHGAVLRAAPAATDSVLTVTDGCSVVRLEIDGGSAAGASATCLTAHSGSGVSISEVHLHDGNGAGLVIDHVTDYTVQDVRVERTTGQGIEAVFSDRGHITSCSVDTALHGVQLWGGDAADPSATTWIDSVEITDCVIRNVRGGIWAARGRNIEVSGNTVHTCSDVGIDFEGCSGCTAADNAVTDATQAALAVFYASSDCTFRGNTVAQGPGMGPGFKAFGKGVSRRITVQDNVFTIAGGPVCTFDSTVLAESSPQCSDVPP